VTSEQVGQLVQEQVTQLKSALAQQGVDLTQFSVDIRRDDAHQFDRREPEKRLNPRRDSVDNNEEGLEETAFRIDMRQGLLYWVA
jgi:flagellar hook-length control protein FliK